jgi:putative resolvase
MKLSELAKKYGVTYRTAWNWVKAGKIKGITRIDNRIYVNDEPSRDPSKKEYVVVYARVSSSTGEDNLDRQAERLVDYCNAKGWVVKEIIKEIASGLNDTRPKLHKLFKNKSITKIVIEHKDRLTRFGFNYIKALLVDCELVVVNENEAGPNNSDIMDDFVSVITCFCARLYGKRRSRRKTEKLIEELSKKTEKDSPEEA